MHITSRLCSAMKERGRHQDAGRDLLHHHCMVYSCHCFEDLPTVVSANHQCCWPQSVHRNFVTKMHIAQMRLSVNPQMCTSRKCDWESILGASLPLLGSMLHKLIESYLKHSRRFHLAHTNPGHGWQYAWLRHGVSCWFLRIDVSFSL